MKENEVPASCTEDGGCDSVIYCEICEKEISRTHVDEEAHGHKPLEAVKENEVPASCTEAGHYTAVVTCETCEAEISRTDVTVPAQGHKPLEAVKENEVPASCTEAGHYTAVVTCETCEAEISRTDVTVPAQGHRLTLVFPREATPESEGVRMHVRCGVCGLAGDTWDSVERPASDYVIPAHAHVGTNSRDESENIAPTCTTPGKSVVSDTYCEICGHLMYTGIEITFPALGHQLTFVPASEPDDAGNDGNLAHYRCERCGEFFYDKDGREIVSESDSLIVRTTNKGSIDVLHGSLVSNYGDIGENKGEMEVNFGSVGENRGVIEENYGTVANNEGGTVKRQFFNMTTEMDDGSYSVRYDENFRSVGTGGGTCLFLEAGASGVITLSSEQGKRITKVTYLLNGEELELEDLGGGQYRLTAPGMPEGPDGFAFNEGNLRVVIEEDPDAADDDSWKSSRLVRLEQQGRKISLIDVIDQDRALNKNDRAIRIEGGEPGVTEKDLVRDSAYRSDIMNAIADAAFGGAKGTMIFVLDDGVRVICDMARMGQVVSKLLPSVNYKSDPVDENASMSSFLAELLAYERQLVNGGIRVQNANNDQQIVVNFVEDNNQKKPAEQFQEKPKPAEDEYTKYFTEPEEDDDDSGGCLTPDTLITLADGSVKRADELEDTDKLLVWDFDSGCLTDAPITFFHRVFEEAPVLRVSFSDGTEVGVVLEHVFFDMTEKRFVAINRAEQEAELLGHSFAKLENGRITEVVLTGIREDGVTDSYYSPVSEAHFNCFANGMLNISGFMKGLYNVFDLEEDALKYDAEKKAAEIEAVGAMPYELVADIFPRSYYDGNRAEWFSVSLAKGLTTEEELIRLFILYGPYYIVRDGD